ncbi:FAD-dependent thymidylate synthase [Streptomyces sp. NBC_01751]|uniref:FAD-dependent thymidylate synthase n=1 Tax=Streptomyces sp. NBC_01751 TaxID=2975929 RepID=UPI002DDB57C7|nr:FAD-dependent thymidylate synthase [Streptomyces sp. NBC_01751]WSD23360.1 FAD-dependent thymidylate synthase [Streptomyces sp. NBC_01751]
MKVTVLASTRLEEGARDFFPPALADSPEKPITDADKLAEDAGRACFKSWSKPNPSTAANSLYLKNIIRQGHFSVLEHASVSFYVEHVSRALLLELERHRFLSFSVESQRYVDTAKAHPEPVIPPAIRGADLENSFRSDYDAALYAYEEFVSVLLERGVPRKKAREAARGVLPNATPVDFVVTGNIRAWRDVLGKRWHEGADAEIREFAGLILDHLREIAPNAVQDVPAKPYN